LCHIPDLIEEFVVESFLVEEDVIFSQVERRPLIKEQAPLLQITRKVSLRVRLAKCINSRILEIQLPHKIINLLFGDLFDDFKLTILWCLVEEDVVFCQIERHPLVQVQPPLLPMTGNISLITRKISLTGKISLRV